MAEASDGALHFQNGETLGQPEGGEEEATRNRILRLKQVILESSRLRLGRSEYLLRVAELSRLIRESDERLASAVAGGVGSG